jgi:hypothetical protein
MMIMDESEWSDNGTFVGIKAIEVHGLGWVGGGGSL